MYTASTALLIGVVIAMVLYLCFKGRTQVMLCTECQQCKSSCPLLSRGCDPVAIMKAAKSGRDGQGDLCTACRACEKSCARGLAPYREVKRKRTKA
jgi:CO dehydrogenase/acetyl-CoA synthase alpha subunit